MPLESVEDEHPRAMQLFVRGLTRAFLGDHEVAIELYLEALQLAPRVTDILAALAESYQAIGDFPTALFYAQQTVENEPGNLYYHHQLARLHFESGDTEKAMATYTALVERFPNDVDGLNQLALLQYQSGRLEASIASYEKLQVRVGPSAEIAYRIFQIRNRIGDPAGIEASLKTLIEIEPDEVAYRRLLADHYKAQDQPAQAVEQYEDALRLDPGDFDTLVPLAELYRSMGQEARADSLMGRSLEADGATPEQKVAQARQLLGLAGDEAETRTTARRLLEDALAADAEHEEALLLLSDLYFEDSLYARAGELYYRSVQLNPRLPRSWTQAALSFSQAGELQQSIDVAEEGLMLFPGHLPLLRISAFGMMSTYQNATAITRFEETLTVLREAPESDPQQESAILASLGVLHARSNDLDASERAYEEAIRLDEGNTVALNNLAFSLAERGLRLQEALEFARRAVDAEPGSASYLDTLGWIYFKLERYDDAFEWIDRALQTGPPTAAMYEHLGDVHFRRGNREAAEELWNKALELNPEHATLKDKIDGH